MTTNVKIQTYPNLALDDRFRIKTVAYKSWEIFTVVEVKPDGIEAKLPAYDTPMTLTTEQLGFYGENIVKVEAQNAGN